MEHQAWVCPWQVVPAESRYELLKTKVEVRLRKAKAATWPSLEARGAGAAPVATNIVDPTLSHPPAYPSSSARRADSCSW